MTKFCVDVIEIGLVAHLRHVAKTMHPYVRTDTRTTKGGSAPTKKITPLLVGPNLINIKTYIIITKVRHLTGARLHNIILWLGWLP